ncbi:MAG: carboxypeptidase regulatory-like domain-containing protein [Planctomycetes bacterium]|nr:carboxypeptidase regulatory-like domain-containing protein [Planctomycetota bacterium]
MTRLRIALAVVVTGALLAWLALRSPRPESVAQVPSPTAGVSSEAATKEPAGAGAPSGGVRGAARLDTAPTLAELRVDAEMNASAGGLELTLDLGCTPVTTPSLRVLAADGRELRGESRGDRHRWPMPAPGTYVAECEGKVWEPLRQSLRIEPGRDEVRETLRPQARNGVRGRVVALHSSEPVRSFRVWFTTRRIAPNGIAFTSESLPYECSSSDGSFCLAGLEVDGPELRVRVDAGARGDAVSAWLPFDGSYWLDDIVVEVSELSASTATLTGRVVSASDRGPIGGALVRVLDAAQTPADGWWIDGGFQLGAAGFEEQFDRFPARFETRSAADGSFAIEHAPPRAARVFVIAAGMRPHLSEELALTAGARVGPLEFALARGASVIGRVATPDAAALRIPRHAWLSGIGPRTLARVSDAGEFRFDGLADGAYRLELCERVDDGFTPIVASRPIEIVDQQDVEVDLPLGLGLTGGSLAGRAQLPAEVTFDLLRAVVLDEAGAIAAEASAPIAADGGFELLDLPAGPKLLLIVGLSSDRSCAAAAATAVVIRSGELATAELDLRRVAVICRVERAGGRVREERLAATALDTEPQRFAELVPELLGLLQTDANGDVRLFGLPRGKYSLAAAGLEPVRFEVVADAPLNLELVVR